ncbi:Inner membrane protein alx [Corynebacterium afermentans subsp. afermentans]|uniref:Tellurite resistance protein TerC n=1 Tax=Corynebacterium afermentans TaxID=38286 RepID=A0A9X8R1C9_9CORY|nr:TerC family protein [Corynebacterium afermentans]OAA17806.1 tellurium resistance protein TerC [Corynebacterium afermentans subsp. afermentans]WJY56960.1 Inner membrane protein alx [Corynebacterium afermentans subsp. afermentans]SIQ00810.1 tellurite resistance protein TerC [Corynebacterium afermentans]
MHVPLYIWLITSAVILGFFVFDFVSHVRTPHEPTMKESGGWALFYMTMAAIFGGLVWWLWDSEHALQFFTGYITELSLSVDNLFVFALIMGSFKIPRAYQQKVLLIGIVMALVFRLVFILLGAVIISAWAWVFYIFAAFLIYTAIKLVYDEVTDQEDPDPNDMFVVKTLRKVIPVTKSYHSDRLVSATEAGKKAVTPLFVALLSIGFIDVMFAFDSIPAIFGITQESFLVFTANAFALLGLRQLYFLLNGLLDKLVYLPYGLAIILGFIGVKLLLHALHENNLPFINGGEGLNVPEVGTVASLLVIVGTLAVTAIASLMKDRAEVKAGRRDPEEGKYHIDYDDHGNRRKVDREGHHVEWIDDPATSGKGDHTATGSRDTGHLDVARGGRKG